MSLTVMLGFLCTGQTQATSDWLNPSQDYCKIGIVKEGFYRVTLEELIGAGFNVTDVPANRFQLFRRGVEHKISVVTDTEGTLDYIEFYAQGNDGVSDARLYDGVNQPHQYYNLFNDTASYFLTYYLTNSSGSRIDFISDNNTSGLSPETYHWVDTVTTFSEVYHRGDLFGTGNQFQSSRYGEGEAWGTWLLSTGRSRDFEYDLNEWIDNSDVVLEITLLGGNNQDHLVTISAGPGDASLSPVGEIGFSEHESITETLVIPSTAVNDANQLVVRVTATGTGSSENIAISAMKLSYAQETILPVAANKIFRSDNQSARSWMQLATTSSSTFRVYDITDPANVIRRSQSNFSDRLETIIPSGSDQIMLVSNYASVASLRSVAIPDYDFENVDYHILTHQQLLTASEEYANYRSSESGGNHTTTVTEIHDIYNVFNYGDPSPVAILNYLEYATSQAEVGNIFIIGKGYDPTYNYFRRAPEEICNDGCSFKEVNIPTYGVPGSDLMYTLGLNDVSPLYPAVPIGRINAVTNEDVIGYLNKIKEMEGAQFDDLFRKDFLHLSGGANEGEINTFKQYVSDFEAVAEGDNFGGRSFHVSKKTSDAVETINVKEQVNSGVGFITFFGHSSGRSADIEIGRVSDPEFGYDNKGKYPIILVNGCKAGEVFGTSITFGEDWISTPDLGALAVMAHSNNAGSTNLKRWSDIYYELGFNDVDYRGASLGELMITISSQYLDRFGLDDVALSQVQQMQLQGDPAYKLYAPENPDYAIKGTDIYVESLGGDPIILSQQDSFKLNIPIRNFGIASPDTFLVSVNRTLPNGEVVSYFNSFETPTRFDTLIFYLSNDPADELVGQNQIQVLIDSDNQILELDELNNEAAFQFDLFSGNTFNLLPINYGIINTTSPVLLWQSSNLADSTQAFEVQIGLSPQYDGAELQSFEIAGENILDLTIDLQAFDLSDTTTFYWRTRLAESEDMQVASWTESSFTYIEGSFSGWGQFNSFQFTSNSNAGIELNIPENQWSFETSQIPLNITTYGGQAEYEYGDIEVFVDDVDLIFSSISDDCKDNSLNAVVLNRNSGSPYQAVTYDINDTSNPAVCGRIDQVIYSFSETEFLSGSGLQELIDASQVGDFIILFNIDVLDYSLWDDTFLTTLSSIGVTNSSLVGLVAGEPIIIVGQVGADAGTATVITTTNTPESQQSINYTNTITTSGSSGSMNSPTIGPAKRWVDFMYQAREEDSDEVILQVEGLKENGGRTILDTASNKTVLDLTNVDETTYQRLQLDFAFNDENLKTPAMLENWAVYYDLPPEGSLIPIEKESKAYQEGEQLVTSLHFKNLGTTDFEEEVAIVATLQNVESGELRTQNLMIAPPKAGDSTLFELNFNSVGMSGPNNLIIEASPLETELYSQNNRVNLRSFFEVQEDNLNPVVDITFDGNHIFSGDVVSSEPVIRIRMRDTNPYLFKSDTSGLNLYLKFPDEETFRRIAFTDPSLSISYATIDTDLEITYQAGPLVSGDYMLRFFAEDASGNYVAASTGSNAPQIPYDIAFEVNTRSAISYFYPFPNPVARECRFIFSITGERPPEGVTIQIVNTSGKLVRELGSEELGPLKLGNNTTDAWDGTDINGRLLPNGLYLYRVVVDGADFRVGTIGSIADESIKGGFGKLYILR